MDVLGGTAHPACLPVPRQPQAAPTQEPCDQLPKSSGQLGSQCVRVACYGNNAPLKSFHLGVLRHFRIR